MLSLFTYTFHFLQLVVIRELQIVFDLLWMRSMHQCVPTGHPTSSECVHTDLYKYVAYKAIYTALICTRTVANFGRRSFDAMAHVVQLLETVAGMGQFKNYPAAPRVTRFFRLSALGDGVPTTTSTAIGSLMQWIDKSFWFPCVVGERKEDRQDATSIFHHRILCCCTIVHRSNKEEWRHYLVHIEMAGSQWLHFQVNNRLQQIVTSPLLHKDVHCP